MQAKSRLIPIFTPACASRPLHCAERYARFQLQRHRPLVKTCLGHCYTWSPFPIDLWSVVTSCRVLFVKCCGIARQVVEHTRRYSHTGHWHSCPVLPKFLALLRLHSNSVLSFLQISPGMSFFLPNKLNPQGQRYALAGQQRSLEPL